VRCLPLRNRAGAVVAEARVDDEDFARLSVYRWCLSCAGGYVMRKGRKEEAVHRVYLHHAVMGERRPGFVVDHINCDRLDNTRANLRWATPTQNNANCGPRRTGKSGFKGVSWHRESRTWRVQIKARGITRCLGYFHDIAAAAEAYRRAAVETFGEFARA
jgi:hypothetical protein